jgi:NAD(P)-dependent dehydrogenase (short-subunit alcohol dehydrogenase family)
MHALGRIAEADEVARAIVFLMDPKNSFITGQVNYFILLLALGVVCCCVLLLCVVIRG